MAHNVDNRADSAASGSMNFKIGDEVVVAYKNFFPEMRRIMKCKKTGKYFLRIHVTDEARFSSKDFDDQWFYPNEDDWKIFDSSDSSHLEVAARTKCAQSVLTTPQRAESARDWKGHVFSKEKSNETFVVVEVRSGKTGAFVVDYVSLKYYRCGAAARENIFFTEDAATIVQRSRCPFLRQATKGEMAYAMEICRYENYRTSADKVDFQAVWKRRVEAFQSNIKKMNAAHIEEMRQDRMWIDGLRNILVDQHRPTYPRASLNGVEARFKQKKAEHEIAMSKMRKAHDEEGRAFREWMRLCPDFLKKEPLSTVNAGSAVVAASSAGSSVSIRKHPSTSDEVQVSSAEKKKRKKKRHNPFCNRDKKSLAKKQCKLFEDARKRSSIVPEVLLARPIAQQHTQPALSK